MPPQGFISNRPWIIICSIRNQHDCAIHTVFYFWRELVSGYDTTQSPFALEQQTTAHGASMVSGLFLYCQWAKGGFNIFKSLKIETKTEKKRGKNMQQRVYVAINPKLFTT